MILNINDNENKVVKVRNHISAFIHLRVFVGKYAWLWKGCIVESMAVIQSVAEICENVLMSVGGVVSHRVVIGDYSYIDAERVISTHSIMAPWSKVDARNVASIDKRSKMNKGVIRFDSNRERNDTVLDAVSGMGETWKASHII